MFEYIYNWIVKHFLVICSVMIVFGYTFILFNLIDIVRKPAEIKEDKESIQNHLLWSVRGECFFVKPYADGMVNLIRVQDCDKK